ncbi:MAG TPA: maleylpyruvate isomerase N-terminal domain-containing protein [Vicinamibacterales bacterium]|jgi:uncharacterized protein (TIGR03083 family)
MIDSPLAPVVTAPLFPELDRELVVLLESLTPDEWERRTIVPKWNVRQIAAHLLDTALRRLSFGRDRTVLQPPPGGDLVGLVNALNAEGVAVYGRCSPRVLIAMTRIAVNELSEYFAELDPFAPASIGVSWAGEERSLNWFDVAREFTERWHHQQQIRLATDRPGIMTPRLYAPVLECFMRALPHGYRNVSAAIGDVARVHVPGDCGGTWHLQRTSDAWALVPHVDPNRIVASTTIPADIAWRIFTKGITPVAARELTSIDGDVRIGSAALSTIAIVG